MNPIEPIGEQPKSGMEYLTNRIISTSAQEFFQGKGVPSALKTKLHNLTPEQKAALTEKLKNNPHLKSTAGKLAGALAKAAGYSYPTSLSSLIEKASEKVSTNYTGALGG